MIYPKLSISSPHLHSELIIGSAFGILPSSPSGKWKLFDKLKKAGVTHLLLNANTYRKTINNTDKSKEISLLKQYNNEDTKDWLKCLLEDYQLINKREYRN